MYTAHVHFFTNLDLFCIDNARVIYRKIRYLQVQQRLAFQAALRCLKVVLAVLMCYDVPYNFIHVPAYERFVFEMFFL